MDKEVIYRNIIQVLGTIEVAVNDKEKFHIIRKQLLDIANDVKRLGDD